MKWPKKIDKPNPDPYDLKYNLLHLLFWAVIFGVGFGLVLVFG